MVNFSLNY